MNKLTFNYYEDDTVRIEDSSTQIKNNSDTLIPGFYKVKTIETMFGKQMNLITDTPKIPNNSEKFCRRHLDTGYLDKLFTERSLMIHQDLNIRRKVGYLLHGKQGSGKTTTMYSISQILIDKYAVCVFSVSNSSELDFILHMLKESRKMKPFIGVILFDECESDFERYESYIKRVLDGDLTPDNTIFICSTNYIDRIPKTIKDRPSRFKYVLDVSVIKEEELVYDILNNMNSSLREEIKLSIEEIKLITPKGIGKTMDEIKNVFINYSNRFLF